MSRPPVVLVVDDEVRILSAVRRTLRREGVETLVAESVAEAHALLAAHPVDVVLSDQKMPGTSGTHFLAEVARRWPDTRRILLTGWPEAIPPAELAAARVMAVLPKPWDDADFRATIRKALS